MSGHTTISVGATPEAPSFAANWVDGQTAALLPVRVDLDDAARVLRIWHDGAELVGWPYDSLRALPDQSDPDMLIIGSSDDAAARLMVRGAEPRRLVRSRSPLLNRRNSHVRKRSILGWGAAALGALALILFLLLPFMADRLAGYLPPGGEKALGDATFEQVRAAFDQTGFAPLSLCEDTAGLAALRKIEDRLTAEMDLATPLTVHVLDHPMVNAFALPGGYVVFFRGLIEQAESPEEVAAVFAHEIGHVDARDPTRIALRSAGSIGVLGVVLGDFSGGLVVLLLAQQIVQADYTKEAEAAADAFAHNALLRADVPPDAIADMFERMRVLYGDDEGIVQHFASHPALGDRIAAARDATPHGFDGRPLLVSEEWQALRSICDRRPGADLVEDWLETIDADDMPPLGNVD